MASIVATPVKAQQTGGNGGAGPAGGTTNALTGAASDGTNGTTGSGTQGTGGGGGGAGIIGGAGGNGGDAVGGNVGGGGGAGGAAAVGGVGEDGGDGGDAVGAGIAAGAGGGGGGSHGAVDVTLPAVNLTGGDGGAGGFSSGAGGGGGGGGYGAFMTGSGGANGNVIRGGRGGNGGASGPGILGDGGAGGTGGVGVFFAAGGTLNNTGLIEGGAGGVGGTAGNAGANGAGGAGVVGASLTIDNTGGSITGGLSGDGVTRADAITFTGGDNTLILGGSAGLTGNIGLGAGSTVTFNQTTVATLTNAITGTGGIIKNGASGLFLSGINTYTGDTVVNAGVLTLQGGAAIADTSAVVINGGSINIFGHETIGSLAGAGSVGITAGVTLTTGGDDTSTTYAGQISGFAANLVKIGSGTLTLSGANSYSGDTTVAAGALNISNAVALGTGSALVQNGATLGVEGSISVSNALTLNGTGVANGGALRHISGLNTLSGAVTLGSASRINSDIGTLILTGAITGSNVDLTFGGAGFTRVRGTIATGTGGLTKDGLGVVYMEGISTYTGTTTINAGSLFLSSGTAIADTSAVVVNSSGVLEMATSETIGSLAGSGQVAIAGTQTLTVGGDNTSTFFSGTISQYGFGDPGSLTKIGTGKLTLTEANTYQGATTISAGAINIRDAAALGGGNVAVASGAALELQGSGLAVGNALTLQGSGVANGGALRNISGANNYDGAITLATASQINSDSGILFLQSVTGANTRLTIGGAGNTSILGNLSLVSGGLTKEGAGILYLAGTNSFSGSTTINNGTVVMTNGAAVGDASFVTVAAPASLSVWASETIGSLAGSGNVDMIGGSELRTGGNNFSTSFAGVISEFGGAGALAKTGTGAFRLTGANTYTGATTVDGGTLTINGSIASSSMTTVNSGATLGGNGTVGNTTINGGTLAPGNSIGLLSVQGNLVFTSASSYMVEVSPANADRVNVSGTATLGGATVNASFAPGSYVTKQYTIVNAAGGVIGRFGNQINTDLPSNFTSSLSYDANNAYLDLALRFDPPVPPGPTPPVYVPLNANQAAVGNALVGYFNRTGGIPLVFGALDAQGLTQVSGELGTGNQQTTFDAMNLFMGVITDPFAAGRDVSVPANPHANEAMGFAARRRPIDAFAAITKAPPMAPAFRESWNVWVAGFGGSRSTDGGTAMGSNNGTSSIAGTAIGGDYWFSSNTVAGFALAGGGTNFSVSGGGAGRSDLFQLGGFVRHGVGSAYVTVAAAYGWQDITTDRNVTAAGLDRLRAQFHAHSFSGRVEFGNRFVTPWMGGLGLAPYAAAQVTAFDLPSYAETAVAGASTFALSYGGKTVTATRTELGFRSDKSFAVNDAILTLRGRAAWAHDFNTDRSIAATFQTLPGASFVVNGAAQARDAALTTAAAEMRWMNGWSVAATFEGEFSDVTRSYSGKGIVRYAW